MYTRRRASRALFVRYRLSASAGVATASAGRPPCLPNTRGCEPRGTSGRAASTPPRGAARTRRGGPRPPPRPPDRPCRARGWWTLRRASGLPRPGHHGRHARWPLPGPAPPRSGRASACATGVWPSSATSSTWKMKRDQSLDLLGEDVRHLVFGLDVPVVAAAGLAHGTQELLIETR